MRLVRLRACLGLWHYTPGTDLQAGQLWVPACIHIHGSQAQHTGLVLFIATASVILLDASTISWEGWMEL